MKKLFKKARFLVVGAMVALTALAMCVTASAASGSTTLDMGTIVSDAGDTLSAQFVAMVTALIPVILAVAMTGLGLMAIGYLFKLAKTLFSKAVG